MKGHNLRMVFFPSWGELRKARQIKAVQALRPGVSRGAGPCSMIVPARVVPLIKEKALVTEVVKPIPETGITLEQGQKMADRKAGIRNFYGVRFFVPIELFNFSWKEWSERDATQKT